MNLTISLENIVLGVCWSGMSLCIVFPQVGMVVALVVGVEGSNESGSQSVRRRT